MTLQLIAKMYIYLQKQDMIQLSAEATQNYCRYQNIGAISKWSQEVISGLNEMTFTGPFQPKPFYDSMIICIE